MFSMCADIICTLTYGAQKKNGRGNRGKDFKCIRESMIGIVIFGINF